MRSNEVARAVVDEGVAVCAAAGCAARTLGAWSAEVSEGDLVFDLASLTKPMTALAIATAGLRDVPLERLLPEVRGAWAGGSTLERLLSHRAGLAANLALFAPLLRGERTDARAALCAAADAAREDRGEAGPDGFAPLYSDLGYVLAGAALARHERVIDAAAAITARVLEPLGLAGAIGAARDLAAVMERAAPTEVVPWRGGVVKGLVHDENAWALTGDGGSGHAGMFGTVAGVVRFGAAALDALSGRGPLGAHDLGWLVRPRAGGSLRAGFDGKTADGYSSAGARMGARAFGHLGFTGTSLWVDPDAEVVVALLTNRVHPTRDSTAIREARPRAHDALFARAEELRQAY